MQSAGNPRIQTSLRLFKVINQELMLCSCLQVRLRLTANGWGPIPTFIHEFNLTKFFSRFQWEIERKPNGNYTIINRGNSLSFQGEPEHGKPVQGIPSLPPREWSLYKATEPRAYQ